MVFTIFTKEFSLRMVLPVFTQDGAFGVIFSIGAKE